MGNKDLDTKKLKFNLENVDPDLESFKWDKRFIDADLEENIEPNEIFERYKHFFSRLKK